MFPTRIYNAILKENIMNGWRQRTDELITLSYIDEDDDWGTDRAGIYRDSKTRQFSLITASGCSCWDGDYDEEKFDRWIDLEKYLLKAGDKSTHPSLMGAQQLLNEGWEKWNQIKNKVYRTERQAN